MGGEYSITPHPAMADPFAEFEQVEEQKVEGDAPTAVSKYLEEERKKLTKAASFSEVKNFFPPEVQEKAETHFYKRQQHYGRIRAKEEEIEGIMERLYTIRYDASITGGEKLASTKNLLAELNRLNEELASMRERGLQQFVETLELDEIGISKRMKSSSFRTPSKVVFTTHDHDDSSAAPAPSQSSHSLNRVKSSGVYGIMRTPSTATFDKQPPREKWKSLYKMYKEWQFQKEVADAQRMASQGVAPPPDSEAAVVLLNEEKNKLRQAIHSLRSRKQLSEADQRLLVVLQEKLKAINNIRH